MADEWEPRYYRSAFETFKKAVPHNEKTALGLMLACSYNPFFISDLKSEIVQMGERITVGAAHSMHTSHTACRNTGLSGADELNTLDKLRPYCEFLNVKRNKSIELIQERLNKL
jgi:hypothetical protein